MTVLRTLQRALVAAVLVVSQASFGSPPIQVFDYFNFVDNSQSSVFGPGGRRLSFGGDFFPTPFNGARIRVTARQGAIARNVPFLFAPGLPNQFFRSITFDPALTGAWTLTIEDLDDPANVATVTTLPICPTLCFAPFGPADPFQTPFIRNAATSDLSTQPVLSWVQPPFDLPPNTARRTILLVHDFTSGDQIVHARVLGADTTSHRIPAIMSGGVPMVPGHKYVISVETSLYNTADTGLLPGFVTRGSELETARSFFSFSPSATPTVFAAPVNLPRVDASGTFTFDLDVTGGTPVLLDPAVAVGYDFAIGAGNPRFASVKLPDLGDFDYTLYLWDGAQWVATAVLPPQAKFDFPAPGVERFRVLGIDPALALDPANVSAFVTEVTFASSGVFNGTMTPVVKTDTTDLTAPVTTASRSVAPDAAGWNRENVVVTLAATDEPGGSGVKSLSWSSTGAQAGGATISGALAGITISQDGSTAIHFSATDFAGNVEPEKTVTVSVDKTAPLISGMPGTCMLWPPNGKLVRVAVVSAADATSGVATFDVSATSSEPADPADIVIQAASGAREIWLRAKRQGGGDGRSYAITATARDAAGNVAQSSATCVVPHDQGH